MQSECPSARESSSTPSPVRGSHRTVLEFARDHVHPSLPPPPKRKPARGSLRPIRPMHIACPLSPGLRSLAALALLGIPAWGQADSGAGALKIDGGAAISQAGASNALTAPVDEEQHKWTLEDALELPEWLSLSGQQRFQFEIFDEPFKPGETSGGNGLFSRTLLKATATRDGFFATAELADSRVISSSSDLPLDVGLVNAFELLQGHIGWRGQDQFEADDRLEIKLGRQTLDLAGRRLVSRQRFRNTINNFTGAYSHWENAAGDGIHAFYFLPVLRVPRDQDSLEDNEVKYDEETSNLAFWGVHAEKRELFGKTDGEFYVYGLDEEDSANFNSRDRNLMTFGVRFFRKPVPDAAYLDLEAAYQTGTSRPGSSAAFTENLDHQAEFLHITAGYQFDAEMDPRAEFVFEYSSGDANPDDGEWGRFDPLFGARRPDYGPPSTLGAFQRSNVVTPGLRFHLKPTRDIQVMVQDRFFYLAEATDAWVTTGLQDPTGAAGDYLGNLIEARVRWDPEPNYRIEMGVAHIFAGSFVDDVPGSTSRGDTSYGYLTTSLFF